MILKSRLFERQQPSRDASLFIIYCEGNRREPMYFGYFEGISSRVRLEIIEADRQGNNSPEGLLAQAKRDLESSDNRRGPKYLLGDEDQVWFVIDTDTWGSQITLLRKQCETNPCWYVAQSNPCFEVWLYCHFSKEKINTLKICSEWKTFVNETIPGGFDSRKHPLLIADAIINAESMFERDQEEPKLGSTEVYKLAKALYPLVAEEVEEARRKLKEL
jgi:hypothetical protein